MTKFELNKMKNRFVSLLLGVTFGIASSNSATAATLGYILTYETEDLSVVHNGSVGVFADSDIWSTVGFSVPETLSVHIEFSDDPATTSTFPIFLGGQQVATSRRFSLSNVAVNLGANEVFSDFQLPAFSQNTVTVTNETPEASNRSDNFNITYTEANQFGTGTSGRLIFNFSNLYGPNADTWISNLNPPTAEQLSSLGVGPAFSLNIFDNGGSEYSIRSNFNFGGPPQIEDLTVTSVPLPSSLSMLLVILPGALGLRRRLTASHKR